MDLNAVNYNVTVDDFDSVLIYGDQAQWTTPDPSARDFDGDDPRYLRGTWHLTEEVGAAVRLNFTGPALYVYGHTGPQYGSYEIKLDGETIRQSAHAAEESPASILLYGATNLTYARHEVTLTNLGGPTEGEEGGNGFLFDYIQFTYQAAPPGASIRNETYEEDDAIFSYTGEWGNNTGPVFSGGGTTYTNEDRATASLRFRGSAIYVLGDIKNDHRIFGITLDDNPEELFSGQSGCGGAFGLTCEQQVPVLKFFGSNLNDSEHTLTITNYAGVNGSFFDLDSVVVTVPTTYAPRELADSQSPFVSSSEPPSTTSPGGGSPSSPPGSGESQSPSNNENAGFSEAKFASHFLILFFIFFALFHRKM